jgi:hypothetical protein
VPPFQLTEKEKVAAFKMAANQKITSIFFKDTSSSDNTLPEQENPFYGKPDEILFMEKYIDLPTVGDYFTELLGSVDIRNYEGRKIFRFNSTRTEMTIYEPLVMIDWVAVNDIEKILAMSPRLIGRIELVNAPYVKGNITYGGIISFISENNDFAGIDLPSSGTFIHYRFLDQCSPVSSSGPISGNIPDSRNTVYWDPEVESDANGKKEIRFSAPDTPGKYMIVLRGISLSGEDLISRKIIEVQE